MRYLLALLFLLAGQGYAQATFINQQCAAVLPDNTNKSITPASMRTCVGYITSGVGAPSFTYAGMLSTSMTAIVSGTVSATHFVGDGSGITGLSTGDSDRIISGSTSVIANGTTKVVTVSGNMIIPSLTSTIASFGSFTTGGMTATGGITGTTITGTGAASLGSIGTGSINASGQISATGGLITGIVTATTYVSSLTYYGDGSHLTGVTGGSSTTPAGSNTYVQFNNSGAFGGSAAFTWNGSVVSATAFKGDGSQLTGISGGSGTLISTTTFTSTTNGNGQTAVGFNAAAGSGIQNTTYGAYAGNNIGTSTQSTAIGYASLASATTGINTAVGYNSLRLGGTANTALGYRAGEANAIGTSNVFIGDSSGVNSTGSRNTVIGALTNGLGAGTDNVILGYSNNSVNGGSFNVALGGDVFNSAGSRQLSIGSQAITGNLAGNNRNLIGVNILSPSTALDISGTISATNIITAANVGACATTAQIGQIVRNTTKNTYGVCIGALSVAPLVTATAISPSAL